MQHSLQALCVEMRARSCRFSAGERWSRRAPVASPADAPFHPLRRPGHARRRHARARGMGAARARLGHAWLRSGAEPVRGRPPPRGRSRGAARERGPSALLRSGGGGRPGRHERACGHAAVRPLARDPDAAGHCGRSPWERRRAWRRGRHRGAVACACGPPSRRPPRRRAVRLRRPASLLAQQAPGCADARRPPRAAPARGPEVGAATGFEPAAGREAGAGGFESGPRRRSSAVARLGRSCAGARRCGRTVARGSNTPRPVPAGLRREVA